MGLRSLVAGYDLDDPIDWLYLRFVCKNTLDWPRPPPEIDYDFVYFAIEEDEEKIWQGVAHSLNDVMEAVRSLSTRTSKNLRFNFIKFDRDKHPIVPLMLFDELQSDADDIPVCASLDFFGELYFGVESTFGAHNCDGTSRKGSLCEYCSVRYSGEFRLVDKGGDYVDDDELVELGSYVKWCHGMEPRSSRMNLEHIGIRTLGCTLCGGTNDRSSPGGEMVCDCDSLLVRGAIDLPEDRIPAGGEGCTEHLIYYSPSWFGGIGNNKNIHSSGPEGQKMKNWIIFKKTIEMHNYF
mmetsp:Transcript_8006/g.14426  ORF Transcript_8006/g.14426 Transcript_8006/m.14426 type:complete len:294 (-) Transcript_8006:110-991(-)